MTERGVALHALLVVPLVALACMPPGLEEETATAGAGGQPLQVSNTGCPVGSFRCVDISVLQRNSSVSLPGRAYAPLAGTAGAPWPLIGLLPGGGAPIESVQWAATRLAQAGYVVVLVQPQYGGQTSSYDLALKSALDFMGGSSNPYRTSTDLSRVGAAGWSLGARTLSQTQEEDTRIDAIVAWDNLAVRPAGDEGSPSVCRTGTLPTGPTRMPRVPALGQASDECAPYAQPVDSKKTAWAHWRAAGVPSMEVVFSGSNHFFWGDTGTAQGWDLAHYYTLAWFDRYVKGDTSATQRLLERSSVLGRPLSQVLSTAFRSAAFLDGRDCPDLRTSCP